MSPSQRCSLAIVSVCLSVATLAHAQGFEPVAPPGVQVAAARAALTDPSPRVFVVAHQDDDFLFPGEEIYRSLLMGARTAVVFVTAGNEDNPGDNPALIATCGEDWECRRQVFIEWRMAGSLAAYFEMVERAGQIPSSAVPKALPSTREGASMLSAAAGCVVVPLPPASKKAYRCRVGTATLYYLGLSASVGVNGQFPENVAGYRQGNDQTLEKLFKRPSEQLPVVDTLLARPGSAAYTRSDLVSVLTGIYEAHDAALIGTLDITLTNYYQLSTQPPDTAHLGWETDHSDHIHAALFAHEAMRQWASQTRGKEVRFSTHRTYNMAFEAANVPCSITAARASALIAYGKWDWGPGYTRKDLNCAYADTAGWGQIESWLARTAFAATRGPFTAARIGAPGGRCLHAPAGAGLGLAACGEAARFSHAADGRLVEATSGRCLTAGAPGLLAECDSPLPRSQRWSVLTDGQVRQADGRCLAVPDGAPVDTVCTSWSETKGLPRATFAQRWTLQLEPSTVSPAFPDRQDWVLSEGYWGSIRMGDVNGDGKADVCGRGAEGVWCALSHGTGLAEPTRWTTAFGDDWGVSEAWYGATLQLGDLNGDGRADVCMRMHDGVRCALSHGSSFGQATPWTDRFSDAQGWAADSSYWGSLRLGDVSGDGKADLCGRDPAGLVCMVSNGMELTSFRFWAAGTFGDARYGATLQLGDMDGDGRADACARGPNGVHCAHSDGTRFGPVGRATVDFSDASGDGGEPSYSRSLRLGDIDGDGRADLCGRTAAGIRCGRSSSIRFERHWDQLVTSEYSDAAGWLPSEYGRTVGLGDLDGDGRADVCGRGAEGMICSLSK